MSKSPDFKPLRVQIGAVDERSAPDLVIGRTELVEALWRQLRAGSVRLLSERRMGKTWVIHLAMASRPDWAAPALFDAQGLASAPEFVQKLNRALHEAGLVSDKWWQTVVDWFRRPLQTLQGQELGKVTLPTLDTWPSFLEDTCRHFVEHNAGRNAVLIVDELPFLLDRLAKTGQEQDAMRLLDILRSLRHEHPSLRIALCGSLGLHIVLAKLHQAGYTGHPVNDMPPFEVPPLSPPDAAYLAGCLLLGEEVPCDDVAVVAEAIATASSGVPFYIQHLVNWMVQHPGQAWTPDRASNAPEELFNARGDPAEFAYYDERLDDYYPGDVVEKARALLDTLSREKAGMAFDTLVNLVRHRPKCVAVDPEQLLKVMRVLRDDHYVVAHNDHWRFKLDIVRQWWFNTRGRSAL